MKKQLAIQDVLFSNYKTVAINSGFIFGINNANYPYVHYYDNLGPRIYQSQNNFGTKNAVILTKSDNTITLDYFDFNAKQIESEQFSVNDNYFLQSDVWTLGGISGGHGLKGYIDNCGIFIPGLLPNQKLPILSGLYIKILPSTYYTLSFNFTGITVAITGQSIVGTVIMGDYNSFLGYVNGSCGNVTSQYGINLLTVNYYQTYLTALTTTGSIPYYTGILSSSIVEDSGYCYSFGMDGISYITSGSGITELYTYPNIDNKTNINKSFPYSNIQNKFVMDQQYSLNQINMYVNGAGQLGSGYSIS